MKIDAKIIKKKATPILIEAGVIRSSLFGSYARGDEKSDSDIDMLVELPIEKSLLDLVRLENKLQVSLGKKVDLITYNSVHPLLKNYIYRDELRILR